MNPRLTKAELQTKLDHAEGVAEAAQETAQAAQENESRLGRELHKAHARIEELEAGVEDAYRRGREVVTEPVGDLVAMAKATGAKRWMEYGASAALIAAVLAAFWGGTLWLDASGFGGLVAKVMDAALSAAIVLGLAVCIRSGPLQPLVSPHADEVKMMAELGRYGNEKAWLPVAVNNGLWGAGMLIAFALVTGLFS